MVRRPVADLHPDIADLYVFTFREAVGNLTPDHAFDNPFLTDMFIAMIIDGFNRCTVTDYCYLIRHIGNLIQLVRDDNHRHPLLLEAEHEVQQCAGIFFVQR